MTGAREDQPSSSSNETEVNHDTEEQNSDGNIVQDEAAEDDRVVPVQYDITSYGADYDVEGLVKRLNRGDIVIPGFQRNYVWTQKEASKFIESLLLGLPVPAIFLVREREDNKLLVIDGQQRLKTLQFFYNGYFNPRKESEKNTVFKLIDVQPQFEGLTYTDLTDKDKIRLNDSLIHAIIIKQESPENDDTSIYYIFDRLNSQGRRLTPQEIRTAIYYGRLIDEIKNINDYATWRRVYGPVNARLKDQELILRFFALKYWESYEEPMNEFLNVFAERHRNPDEQFLYELRKSFVETIDVMYASVGRRAFRLGSAINAAVFDSVMIGVSTRLRISSSINTEALRVAYHGLLGDEDFLRTVSRATSNATNVETRIKKAIQAFEGV
jgi:hypothetical protein